MFAHKSYVLKHQGVVYHFYCAVNHAGQRGIAVATSVPMGRSQVSFPTLEKKGKRQIMSLNQDWQVSFGKTSEDSITKMGNLPGECAQQSGRLLRLPPAEARQPTWYRHLREAFLRS